MTEALVLEAAKGEASRSLGENLLRDVRVDRDVDSDGKEILRITVVLPEGAIDSLMGGKILQANVAIKNAIRRAGEDRWSVIQYATPEELSHDGDPEF